MIWLLYLIHTTKNTLSVPLDEMDDMTLAVCDPFETSVCRTSETHYVLRGQG